MAPFFSGIAGAIKGQGGFGFSRKTRIKYGPFSVEGGVKTTSGAYTIHTFTSNSTLTINGAGDIEFLVVGGGGNGGNNWTWPMPGYCVSNQSCPPNGQTYSSAAAGGGAGGYRSNVGGTPFRVVSGVYPVVVGSGGQGAVNGASAINFPSPIQASGGGNGIIHPNLGDAFPEIQGNPGGSGSGASGRSYNSPTASKTGGTGGAGGLDPRCNPASEGNPGGTGDEPGGAGGFIYIGGSGGGAGGAGSNGGAGGTGITNSISGTSVTYCVGGSTTGSGSGSPGTGSGGGGATASGSGGNGAPGIVIIRYLTSLIGTEEP